MVMSARSGVQAVAGALALQILFWTPALADVTIKGGCIGGGGMGNCVVTIRKGHIGSAGIYKVEEPRGEELEAAMERDRQWAARCKPVIRQDAYGVGKYYYAASGCEFGKTDNY
jgi:hypothetical protein